MFRENEIFQGTYQIIREIGSGGTGKIYLAYHLRLRKYVVIKQIRSNFTGVLSNRNEADILKNLHHPALPQVLDFIQNGQEVCTVMDYVEGTDFTNILERGRSISEKTLRTWLKQLLNVLEYLHSRRPPIIHSDIKPGNIILRPDGSVCLIDFNISLDGSQSGKIIGYSDFYAAPEQGRLAKMIQNGQECDTTLDGRTDLYSLAAVFYHLISGRYPYNDRENPPLETIAAGRYSTDFLRLIDRAMRFQPGRRFRSAAQMAAALDRIERNTKERRQNLLLQIGSFVISAILLGVGLFCIIRGINAAHKEDYQEEYDVLVQAVEDGDTDLILKTGNSILDSDSYQSVLQSTPEDHCAILHTIGDCYYDQEEYSLAAFYYKRALDFVEDTDPLIENYYSDAAVALAMSGDTAGAQELLVKAQIRGITDERQLLIQASIYLSQDKAGSCLSAVQELIDDSGDSQLCAQACLIASRASDGEERLEWLQKADSYNRTRQTLRQLGTLCMQLYEQSESSQADQYCRQALSYYEDLCSYTYVPLEDQLNLAIVQLTAGNTTASIQTLRTLLLENPDDYRIEMYLAFAYDEAGDSANASLYAYRAEQHWAESTDPDKYSADSDEIQSLLQLLDEEGFPTGYSAG